MPLVGRPKPPSGGGNNRPQAQRAKVYSTDPSAIPMSHVVEKSFTQLLAWAEDYFEPASTPTTLEMWQRIEGFSEAARKRLAKVASATQSATGETLLRMAPAQFLDQLGIDAWAVYQQELIAFDLTTNAAEVERKLAKAGSKRPTHQALGVSKLVVVHWYVDKNFEQLSEVERLLLVERLTRKLDRVVAQGDYCTDVFLSLE